MATEARKLQLGLFVIGATLIAIGALVWLGASRFFEKTDRLVAYFSETVQGLEPGAAVKYRGVPAGRVESIGIAPDGDLIEIVMSVDEKFSSFLRDDPKLRAQIQLVGITGLRYVEIDRHVGEALERSPVLGFDPPYPVIRSTPSSIRALQSSLEDLYARVIQIDFGGISQDVRATLQSANTLLGDERIQDVLTNIKEVTLSTAAVTAELARVTREVQLSSIVSNVTDTSAEARDLVAELRRMDLGARLSEALGQVSSTAQSTQQFVVGLQNVIDRMERTVSNLERVTAEIGDQPSRLLFAAPPEIRRPGGEP